jgi:hypothetical protein
MWQSQTPAWYALPINKPLSFKDKFSFSCRVAFMPTGGAGVAYLGFFNDQLQGWRVWNSMAVRLGGESSGQAAIGGDAMTALWHACGGSEGYIHVPQDGKPHTIRFSYDPDALPGPWPDPRLRKYLTPKRQTTEQILEKAQKDEPNLTKDELWKRLQAAHADGLIYYLQRTGHESIIGGTSWSGYFWGIREGLRGKPDGRRGAMILQVNDGPAFKIFVFKEAHDEPVFMNRFGLFNLQMYHQYIDLYLSELVINGHRVDLSKEPGWESHGNRVRFVEQDFQRQDFGYSETNWAGERIGELGGTFFRAEPNDPIFGYYADDVGTLTLDDPISFSGNVCFTHDSTDTGMYFGFFNRKDYTADFTSPPKLKAPINSMGILIDGHAQYGKFFCPQVTSVTGTAAGSEYVKSDDLRKPPTTLPAVASARRQLDFPFRPTAQRHPFKFSYDPKANNNVGRITLTLDQETISIDLDERQRAEGAVFDRFGVASLRTGGKFMTVYLDDLSYTARRSPGHKPAFHRQEVVKVPYPPSGRKY